MLTDCRKIKNVINNHHIDRDKDSNVFDVNETIVVSNNNNLTDYRNSTGFLELTTENYYYASENGGGTLLNELDENDYIDDVTICLTWPKLGMVLLFSLLIIVTVIGNTLVILSVMTTRRLRTVTNCFVMSLAMADWLVGVTVMPPAVFLYIVGKSFFYLSILKKNKYEINSIQPTHTHTHTHTYIPSLMHLKEVLNYFLLFFLSSYKYFIIHYLYNHKLIYKTL